ncbi:hypothetical protein [Bythopirellula goksoeyrii]|uniref:PEP-CTERM protein-sorting domain-containing protein n=1 Tax=Bythopirellula goksoeyrii TaxID=1400387 RepID=A0A5B9Q8X4_9BACT|nr:hypothetical protein [Bythopirellula goksoeyrii]QEG33366.1 hypothetical protein Pr1d_06270 [Bythopirellula goksoeyrii]
MKIDFSRISMLAIVATAALALSAGSAPAVLVGGAGGYDVDPTLGVGSISGATGSFSTNSHSYAQIGALGYNWGGIYVGGTAPYAARRLNFLGTDPGVGGDPNTYITGSFLNPIFNNPGIDIIIFESGGTPTNGSSTVDFDDPTNTQLELVAASLSGTTGTYVDFVPLDFLTDSEVGGSSTTFGVYVYGLDLSSLSVAGGTSVSSLYFGNSGAYLDHDPDVVWGGGVTGAAVAVPEASAGLCVLLAGVLGIGGPALRRRFFTKKPTTAEDSIV